MYEGWDPFTPNTSTLHAGTTEFIGHLDEVAGYYRTHHVKGHGVVADTHTLYTIVDTPTASVRVKWLATKTSSLDGFVAKKRRDFCVLEVKYKLLYDLVVCTACNPSWSVLVNGHLTKRRACTLCSLASKPSKPVATPSIHRDDLVPSLGFRSSDATTIDRDDSMSRYSDSTMGYHT
ncbi:hypothetical protein B5M09_012686 [Aphanomyces astaci]|uniref:Uncharacterized protein n=1 Tax=Aphanomyces astaci TaxID=112090 RepID=A0A3R7ZLM2_APHAT|nr:hypothetical protein B5M09_012686 [Aphanomyces astaci]